jgi:hypothetical protein
MKENRREIIVGAGIVGAGPSPALLPPQVKKNRVNPNKSSAKNGVYNE